MAEDRPEDGNTREEESSALYDGGIKEKNEGVKLFPGSLPLRGRSLRRFLR